MKTWKNMALCGLISTLAIIASGCAYMDVQRPLSANFNNTQLGSKEGRANSYSVLWLLAWGNAGTKAAALQGNIKIIHHADVEVKSILFGTYTRMTTVVYGD